MHHCSFMLGPVTCASAAGWECWMSFRPPMLEELTMVALLSFGSAVDPRPGKAVHHPRRRALQPPREACLLGSGHPRPSLRCLGGIRRGDPGPDGPRGPSVRDSRPGWEHNLIRIRAKMTSRQSQEPLSLIRCCAPLAAFSLAQVVVCAAMFSGMVALHRWHRQRRG